MHWQQKGMEMTMPHIKAMPHIGSFTGHTIIYADMSDGSIKPIGELNACSFADPDGPCYVHVYKDMRHLYGLPDEPYDWFFILPRAAWKWVKENVGDTWV